MNCRDCLNTGRVLIDPDVDSWGECQGCSPPTEAEKAAAWDLLASTPLDSDQQWMFGTMDAVLAAVRASHSSPARVAK